MTTNSLRILVHSSYCQIPHVVRPEAEIYIGLAQRGHTITIACEPGNYFYYRRFLSYGITVLPIYPKNKIDLSAIHHLHSELKQGYDIAIGYNAKTIPNLAFASIGLPHALVAYRGTVGGLYRHDPTAYLAALHPRVDGIICVSNAVHEDVIRRSFLPKQRIVTIYKGHDIAWYNTTPANRSELGLPTNAFIIICVVNARPSKGVEVLLDAFAQLNPPNHVHLLLVGRNFDKAPYATSLAQHPNCAQIHNLGYREDILALMSMADIQIQPSVSGEGLPKAIVEAMGSATPTITTTTGGGKELVIDGETGFVVPKNNAKAIAQHLTTLIANPTRTKAMGIAARARLKNVFTLTHTIEAHERYFHWLSAEKSKC